MRVAKPILIVGLIAVGVIILAVLVNRVGQPPSNAAPGGVSSTGPARSVPGLTLKDYAGQPVNLASAFPGKALVINSWAAWCPFCGQELKDFAAAQREYGDRLVIIAVDRAESLTVAKRFTDDLGVTDGLTLLLDPNDTFYQGIGGFAMPETIFVAADGTVRDHKRGPMDLEEIRQRIVKLLAT